MNPNVDIVRTELERLFSLDEMTSMSRRLLGLDPREVGGATTKAAFAQALAEHCLDGDRIDALVDAILASRQGADPRLRDVAKLLGDEELPAGHRVGEFEVVKTLGQSELSIVYLARRGDESRSLKLLRREACRDRRALQRFLTANRLVAAVEHPGLPVGIDAGESDGAYWVSYRHLDAQSLRTRFTRTGPAPIEETKRLLCSILEPLAALHAARIVHGDLKLENVLVERGDVDGSPHATLIDFGTDRLWQRPTVANGHTGVLAVFGSPRTVAPEQVRGLTAGAATDVYAFGAMMYELLSGQSVFPFETATEAAFSHLFKEPEAPSTRGPRGWISKDVDRFVLSLLAKDPAERPCDARAVLDGLESLGRASAQVRAARAAFPEEDLAHRIEMLAASPHDAEAVAALEGAIEEGADATKVARAFEQAAGAVEGGDSAEGLEVKRSLLYRAARVFDAVVRDKEHAETLYEQLVALDPSDEIAQIALDDVRKALGKYAEVVESLMARGEQLQPGGPRARIFAEIGRLCAGELEDPDQGIVAYARALCESPGSSEIAEEIERLAEGREERWNEVVVTLDEGSQGAVLPPAERNRLLAYAGQWYEHKLGRTEKALLAYQQILAGDPENEAGHEGLIGIYRRTQQLPELVGALVSRANAAGASPRARELRAEAAEVCEQKLNDFARAKDMYAEVLAADPGHARAGDGMIRIAERTGDSQAALVVLERRAESRRGRERVDALLKIAQGYEERLDDLAEAKRRYEAVLVLAPAEPQALKGLDRIYNRTGQYRELLDNLEQQLAAAATPRQRITIYERMAALYDEEFLDHERAVHCLERVLELDPGHEGALGALPKHYRALGRWEELEKVYERHALAVSDPARRAELMLERARVLADSIGSPDRAMRAYEQVLEIRADDPAALDALAHLRELSGDAQAALVAIEALASNKAAAPEARAEQWVRAARLLEGRGDRDGAIERYKLALEANPKDSGAAVALRQAYAARGEVASVVALIEAELEHAEGKVAKARLYAELARVERDRQHAGEKAEASAKLAIDLDPTNAEALLVLGDIAYEAARHAEACQYLEPLVARAHTLPEEDAVRAVVRYVEAYGYGIAGSLASNPEHSAAPAPLAAQHPRLAAALQVLGQIAPDDPIALARVGRVMLDCGDAQAARAIYERLIDPEEDAQMAREDRAEALWRMGEALRQLGELDKAIDFLREASDMDAASPEPLQVLARIYGQTGNWGEYVHVKRRRLDVASGVERFELLLEIGEAESGKLGDRGRAIQAYVAALEEKPDDRRVLTALAQLYTEEKDWAKLLDVVLRLAEFVDDPKQRAKYMHTVAIVSARQLGEVEQALSFYERAIACDSTLTKAVDEAVDLYARLGNRDAVERLLKGQLELAKESQDRAKVVGVLDKMGDLYKTKLGEPELAIDAYEAALAFDPDGKQRSEVLAELYASNVEQYLDKAVKAQSQMLRQNPYRVESYKLLRRLYTEARKPDPAWCLCQALGVLGLAEADEERFYRLHRADNAAAAQAALDETDWTERLAHPDADPLVTRIFALIQPTIIRARTQPLDALGYDSRLLVDVASQPHAVTQTLHYVQGVFGFDAPPIFQNLNDPSGLGFLHAHTPAIVLGRAAFETEVPNQSLAFVAGRHMTYFRPGYYVRHLIPTGTGLKAWLFAAIKLCVPQFPVAPELQGQVQEALALMAHDFVGVHREILASTVSKLLQSGGSVDLKKWVSAIDLTADRAGFLLAHDLYSAVEVMRATEDASSVGSKERVKEIVLFSVGEEYFSLREKLQITVDS